MCTNHPSSSKLLISNSNYNSVVAGGAKLFSWEILCCMLVVAMNSAAVSMPNAAHVQKISPSYGGHGHGTVISSTPSSSSTGIVSLGGVGAAAAAIRNHQSSLSRICYSVPTEAHGIARAERARSVRVWCSATTTGATKELPPKLQEIVRLFQGVKEPRAKYEQLLWYGKNLSPLGEEYCTKENKVEGCVSQVWVVCRLDEDRRVWFQAQSDSVLTKGLAALLVEGLSGATVEEVLKVTPDFVHMLGLKQSLTPSRNNGFLNMLKLMQKKTLQSFTEGVSKSLSSSSAASGGGGSAPAAAVPEREVASVEPPVAVAAVEMSTMKDSIQKKLTEGLAPVQLEVEDVSYQHAGHAGAPKGSSETHFNVKVVSESFQGRSLVKRHRLVYDLLKDELQNGVHALSLVTKTPSEISA